jgi:hypothetical protein
MSQGFRAALAAQQEGTESRLQSYRESRSQGRTMRKEFLRFKFFWGPRFKLLRDSFPRKSAGQPA